MGKEELQQSPGCGMAAFSLLLFGMFLVGITGITLSTSTILWSSRQLTPEKLSYGGVVDSRVLKPMREAGALREDEIPDAYHAEDASGKSACAISSGRVVRIGPEGVQQTTLAGITSVTGTDTEVVIHGDTSFVCHFGPDEGADRFLRMLENRGKATP